MDDREKRVDVAKSDRVTLELSIVAAILFIIVFVGGNPRLVESSINCATQYIGALCAATAEK
jgi:hypothetical protein